MTTLFDARRKPIPLPDPPRLSRADADAMYEAGLTLTQWDALTDGERAEIRWNTKNGATT